MTSRKASPGLDARSARRDVTGRGRTIAFLGSSLALVASFAASAAPIPLFNHYRFEDGLSNADLSLVVVAYFIGAMTSLLFLGRLSDHLGRRNASLITIALGMAGCGVLLTVHSAAPLVTGRVLQGLSCGLASSALTSYIVDSAPPRPHWLGATVASTASLFGLTLGALGSGAIVEYGPNPRVAVYLLAASVLAVCGVILAMSPDTVEPRPGALRALRPRVHTPAEARHLFPVAAFVFVSTWGMGAFYQAFGPSVTADQLGTRNAVVVAAVFSSFMAPPVLSGALAGRFTAAGAQRLGMAVFVVGVAGALGALWTRTIVLFLVASVIAGAGQGMACTGSIRGIVEKTPPHDRAATMSAIFLICYAGAAVPSLVSGQLSHIFTLAQIALGYGAMAVVALVVTLVGGRRTEHARALS